MIVRLADFSGFCFGVRRAIQLALEAVERGENVFTLGELIHNPQFVKELEGKGIKVAKSASELHNSVVIIRSHGITKQEYEILSEQGNRIVDATCPYVTKTHDLIRQANSEGYPVCILGDENHPEIIGMRSFGNNDTMVVAPQAPLPKALGKRLCVISQTTQKIEYLNDLVVRLIPKLMELKIFNTICLATSQRQNSSAELAKNSDLMIVIGGKQSSNTKMLANVCAEYTACIHIETEDELDPTMLADKERIGIAAGASTPENRIVSVYNRILKINGEEDLATSIQNIPLFKEESC
ncbi:MAG: 4-hydroxy-3-methylbut-2-enyl diphosphate reductase [Candidatus Cloacimonetes bacterium]|nr:4-hydroxy-3-methylbut-2-enyl diphosphate reductase [Candidatus Cloacimonadota bacterium]